MESLHPIDTVDPSASPPVQDRDSIVRGLDRIATILPPMPGVVARLQQELSNEWVNIQRLGNVVRTDPALAGAVLRAANSPFWRGSRQIAEVEEGIQRIGMETLRSLVTVMAVKGSRFGAKPPEGLDQAAFWKHSLLVAVGSVQLARRCPVDRNGLEQVWMAGLLHDIGVLLAPHLYPIGWARTLQALEAAATQSSASPPETEGEEPSLPRIDLLELERIHLGVDHAGIGSVFVHRHWNLPESISLLVEAWTAPQTIDPPLLAWVVRRADEAAQVLGVCWQPESTRLRDMDLLPKDSGAAAACDPATCLECVQKSIPLVEALLGG